MNGRALIFESADKRGLLSTSFPFCPAVYLPPYAPLLFLLFTLVFKRLRELT